MTKTKRKRWYTYRRKVTLSSLQQMCGYWTGACNSPPVHIFRTNQGYRITFEYRFDTRITVPIKRTLNLIVFDLFGRIEIAYDNQRDVLLIATEGTYSRANHPE